jgi:hypothetical protein
LGLLGFAFALGAVFGRKMGVGLALFGFALGLLLGWPKALFFRNPF